MSVAKKPNNFNVASASNGQVLTVDHTQPSDVKWANPGESWVQVATGTASGSALNLSNLSGYDKYLLVFSNISDTANTGQSVLVRLNADSGANYRVSTQRAINNGATSVRTVTVSGTDVFAGTFALDSNAASATTYMSVYFTGCLSSTGWKRFQYQGFSNTGTVNAIIGDGIYASTNPVTSINTAFSGSSNYDAGTYYLYGSN